MKVGRTLAVVTGAALLLQGCVIVDGEMLDKTAAKAAIKKKEDAGMTCTATPSSGFEVFNCAKPFAMPAGQVPAAIVPIGIALVYTVLNGGDGS